MKVLFLICTLSLLIPSLSIASPWMCTPSSRKHFKPKKRQISQSTDCEKKEEAPCNNSGYLKYVGPVPITAYAPEPELDRTHLIPSDLPMASYPLFERPKTTASAPSTGTDSNTQESPSSQRTSFTVQTLPQNFFPTRNCFLPSMHPPGGSNVDAALMFIEREKQKSDGSTDKQIIPFSMPFNTGPMEMPTLSNSIYQRK